MVAINKSINKFSNRAQYVAEFEALLALDNPTRLAKAFSYHYHPLTQAVMNQIATFNAIQSAEFILENRETFIATMMKVVEEKERYEHYLRDAIASEELVKARESARELQDRMAKQERMAAEAKSGSIDEKDILKGLEVIHAWMESEKQNIKRVKTDIVNLNHQIEKANTDWADVQQQEKVQAINQFVSNHPKLTLEILTSPKLSVEAVAQAKEVVIDLASEQKRKQLEAAYEIPAPGKALVMNQKLYDAACEKPEKAAHFLGIMRDIRMLGAMAANAEDVSDHRVMLACAKKKFSNPCSKKEEEKITEAVHLLKQRKAKEDTLKRLEVNLENASNKFNLYQSMLAKISTDNEAVLSLTTSNVKKSTGFKRSRE